LKKRMGVEHVMFVRVFDQQSNTYFKSEVYAVINSGWYEKQLVVFSSGGDNYFKFFDFLDKSDPENLKVLINSISFSDFHSEFEWIHQRTDAVDKQLEDYRGLLDEEIRFFEYRGYSWIYKDKELLAKLLKGEMVLTKDFERKILDPNAYKLEGWQYIETQQDVDFILKQTAAFHDSVLKEVNYISGSYVDEKNSMCCTDNERRVTMRVDSQWCRPIEMVFEGLTALNLRPASDRQSSAIFEATLLLQNASVFFCEDAVNDTDEAYTGTWIKAYGLRWRFV